MLRGSLRASSEAFRRADVDKNDRLSFEEWCTLPTNRGKSTAMMALARALVLAAPCAWGLELFQWPRATARRSLGQCEELTYEVPLAASPRACQVPLLDDGFGCDRLPAQDDHEGSCISEAPSVDDVDAPLYAARSMQIHLDDDAP